MPNTQQSSSSMSHDEALSPGDEFSAGSVNRTYSSLSSTADDEDSFSFRSALKNLAQLFVPTSTRQWFREECMRMRDLDCRYTPTEVFERLEREGCLLYASIVARGNYDDAQRMDRTGYIFERRIYELGGYVYHAELYRNDSNLPPEVYCGEFTTAKELSDFYASHYPQVCRLSGSCKKELQNIGCTGTIDNYNLDRPTRFRDIY